MTTEARRAQLTPLWRRVYVESWRRLLSELPEDKRKLIVSAPQSEVAAHITALAYQEATEAMDPSSVAVLRREEVRL